MKNRENSGTNHLLLAVRIISLILLFIFHFFPANIYASGAFPLNDPSTILIGNSKTYTIKNKETLVVLAREYSVGYNEIVEANSHVDPWIPQKGSRITIPTFWLLPEKMDSGVLINLAEMRLYYFFNANDRQYVSTYPIGIGRQGFDTPTGTFKITAKLKNPVWRIPVSFREEYPDLPDFVPPGPDNPLGKYWLQLSVNGYGIHGTNKPYGIGRKISHGCIRLYPEDIDSLFKFIKNGTKVKIINEPVKVGLYDDKVIIELHNSGSDEIDLLKLAVLKLGRKHLLNNVDTELLLNAVNNATGLPAIITK